jgi:hypothetical protein
MSSAKGMGQCDNVQSALQAQELVLVQHYKLDSWYKSDFNDSTTYV